jgi:cytochrome P450
MVLIKVSSTQHCIFLFSGLSRAEVMDEMLSLLTGSCGPIATALAWFIHLMSKHPRVQIKIKKELADYNVQYLSAEQLDLLIFL